MSVFDPIRFQSAMNPDRLALVGVDCFVEAISYGGIDRAVRHLAGLLADQGVSTQQRVGVWCADNILHVAVVLALDHIGVQAISLASEAQFATGSVDVAVYDQAAPAGGNVPAIRLEANRILEQPAVAAGSEKRDQTVLAFARTASKISGPSESVRLNAGQIRSRILRRAIAKRCGESERWVCAADIRSEIGFSMVLETLWTGGAVILSSGRFETDLQPIELYSAQTLFISAEWLQDYLSIFSTETALPRAVRRVVISGVGFQDDVTSRVQGHLANDVTICLDAPEVGVFAAASSRGVGAPSCYKLVPGAEVQILDATHNRLLPGETGIVAIRSLDMVGRESGNLDNDDRQAKNGLFGTDLSGSVDGEGNLSIVS